MSMLSVSTLLGSLKDLIKLFVTPMKTLVSNMETFPAFFVDTGKKMLKMEMSLGDFFNHFQDLAYGTIKDVIGKTLVELVNQIAEKTLGFDISEGCACIVTCCLDQLERKMRDDFQRLVGEMRNLVGRAVDQANEFKDEFLDTVDEITGIAGEGLKDGVGDVKSAIEGIPDFFLECFENAGSLVETITDISNIRNVSHFNAVFEDVLKLKNTVVGMLKKLIAPFATLSKTLIRISAVIVKMIRDQIKGVFEKLIDIIRETNRFLQATGDNIQEIMTPPSWLTWVLSLDRDTLDTIREVFATFQKAVDLELLAKGLENTMLFLEGKGAFADMLTSVAEKLAVGAKNCQSLIEKCISLDQVTSYIRKMMKKVTGVLSVGVELGEDIKKALKELEEFGVNLVDNELERAVQTVKFVKGVGEDLGNLGVGIMKDGIGLGGKGIGTGLEVAGLGEKVLSEFADESLEMVVERIEEFTKVASDMKNKGVELANKGLDTASEIGKEGVKMVSDVSEKTIDVMVNSTEKVLDVTEQGMEMGKQLASDVTNNITDTADQTLEAAKKGVEMVSDTGEKGLELMTDTTEMGLEMTSDVAMGSVELAGDVTKVATETTVEGVKAVDRLTVETVDGGLELASESVNLADKLTTSTVDTGLESGVKVIEGTGKLATGSVNLADKLTTSTMDTGLESGVMVIEGTGKLATGSVNLADKLTTSTVDTGLESGVKVVEGTGKLAMGGANLADSMTTKTVDGGLEASVKMIEGTGKLATGAIKGVTNLVKVPKLKKPRFGFGKKKKQEKKE